MVSVPFYLVVLIEIVILESLAIAGFFVFRWWREKQDQVVLEALVTATETSALARNHVLKTKLTEAVPESTELAEKADLLAQAEILFQRRLLAAFLHERLLSLGHLPDWTEELLVPYQTLIEGVKSVLAASGRDHQQEIEQQVERLNTELTQSRNELKQTREETEVLDRELTSTKDELGEKAAKIESLEREYVSAFHTNLNTAPPESPPVGHGEPTQAAAAPPPQTPPEPKSEPAESRPERISENDAIVTEIAEEETAVEAVIDFTIDDEDVELTDENEEEAVLTPAPENASVAPENLDIQESVEEAAATTPSDQTSPSSAKPSRPETSRMETKESQLLIMEDDEEADTELDWGAALEEQATAEAEASDENLDWGAALEEQAAASPAANDEDQLIKDAAG